MIGEIYSVLGYFFQVPDDFDAAQTFDLFFKVHKVFNLDFDPNIKPMMQFIEHSIFGIKIARFRESLQMKALKAEFALP